MSPTSTPGAPITVSICPGSRRAGLLGIGRSLSILYTSTRLDFGGRDARGKLRVAQDVWCDHDGPQVERSGCETDGTSNHVFGLILLPRS